MSFKSIGDYVELQRGTTYKSALLDQEGPYLLGLGSIARDGGFRSEKLRTYGGPSADKLLVYPGDMYVSLKDVTQSGDLLGSVARVPDTVKVGRMTQDTVKLCFKSDISKEYFYWILRSPQYRQHCRSHATGTTNLGLSRDDFFSFVVPELTISREKITNVLEDIESKINLNSQTNQTLEEMAQAIFKSWFVDFDPVKAKMNGEQPEGMDAATASLFPEKLVESELGLIPEGWSVNYLNEVAEIKYGKNLPKTKLLDDGYPVFGGNGVIGYYSSYLYEEEQVLVSCRGAASGKVLRSLPNSFVTNNSLVIELSNGFLNINYVEPYLKGCNLEEYTSGSAQPQMTVANMAPVQILVPTEEVLNIFNDLVKPLKSKIRANERENHSLAALRDTLLPKLLSGEIELGQTEEMV
ncbi:restriction endonuclease subunit S [Vibrio minamisatsumaniensis]|uniref:restriction endonuclease subunit S n=1 Tax=Vibrio minamisatsumaniensis TaxID=2910243 RepID=UPI003D1DEA9D